MRAELAAVTAALVLLVPAAARADDSYVALTTDDTSVPGGRSFLYTPADSTISMHSGTSGSGMDAVYVDVRRGSASDTWSFGFVSPDGSPLHTGVYDDVGPSGEGRPGFNLTGQGAGCEPDAGRFEI